jgi:hypothetical protein
MKLSKMFPSNEEKLRRAIDANDLAAAEKLMAKKIPMVLVGFSEKGLIKNMTREMAQLFMDKIDNDVFPRWTSTILEVSNAKEVIPSVLVYAALHGKRYDLVDMLMSRPGMAHNSGEGKNHQAAEIIAADAPAADRLRWLKTVLADGFDKIKGPEALPLAAVERNFPEAITLFAAIGFDLHKDNEYLLRAAVRGKQADICRLLVKDHNADPEAVLRPARELGKTEDVKFLEETLKDLPPRQMPTTMDTALAEIQSLRATVRELTEKVETLQGPSKLDKPILPKLG